MISFPSVHVLRRPERPAPPKEPKEMMPPVLAAVTWSPGEMVIEDVSWPEPARPGNVIVRSHHFPLTRAAEAFEFQ
jgi:hypothetical protein